LNQLHVQIGFRGKSPRRQSRCRPNLLKITDRLGAEFTRAFYRLDCVMIPHGLDFNVFAGFEEIHIAGRVDMGATDMARPMGPALGRR